MRDTQAEAYEAIKPKAPTMRQKVMAEIDEHGPGAATQLASRMSKPVTSIRPRLTELAMDGAIQDTGNRHKLPGGTSEIVWAAV